MRHSTIRCDSPAARRAVLMVSLLPVLLTPGCATILAGGPDLVPIDTKSQGAKVTLDGVAVGRTPCTVTFARSCEGVVKLEADGYEPSVVDQDKVLNGWFLGNILLGGLIGITIDLCTSNQGKYSTTPLVVELLSSAPSR
jgi:PEGA domain